MKPLGLYIHIPFCARKCRYCDFVSFPGMEDSFDRYIDSVLAEAGLYSAFLNEHTVDTLFIGGGTPSILSPKQIRTLIGGLKDCCSFRLKEATIEANPESLSEEKLAAYSECGIDRISIGLQTHDDDILKTIGRGHTFEGFLFAYESAKRYFNNINVDTIFGLPEQTAAGFEETIRHLIDISPSHVSAYSLKLEQGTPLAESFFGLDDDTDRDMYHKAVSLLEGTGYTHYETSNFAKENVPCLHNLKYWRGEEYLGLGAAAHSYTFGVLRERFSNTENMNEYMKAVKEGQRPVINSASLTAQDEMTEYIMLRLRLREGISYSGFYDRFNISFKESFKDPIDFAENAELITTDEHGIYPALKGFDLQNTLITEFMKII